MRDIDNISPVPFNRVIRINEDFKLTMDDLDLKRIESISHKGISAEYMLDTINQIIHNVYLLSHYELPEKWPIYYFRSVSDSIFVPSEICTSLHKDKTIMNVCEIRWLHQFIKSKPGFNVNELSMYNIQNLSCQQLITYEFMNNLASFAKGRRCLTINSGNGVIGAQLLERGIDTTITTPGVDTVNLDYHENYWDQDHLKFMSPIDTFNMANDYNFIIIDNPIKDLDRRDRFVRELAVYMDDYSDITYYVMPESIFKDLNMIIDIGYDAKATSILSKEMYYHNRKLVDPYVLCVA